MCEVNKVRGCLVGGAVGDALGYQIEFKRNIKLKEFTRFCGKGIISDDTQMTLFTANALIWRETRLYLKGITLSIVDSLYLAYKDWLDTQNNKISLNPISWLVRVPELNVPRAPGNTCIGALSSGVKGTVTDAINDSKGCGGVMRVAPIGIYIKDAKIAGKVAADASALTHGHPLGIIPAYVFSVIINFIIYENKTIKGAVELSIKQLLSDYNIFDKVNTKSFVDLMNKAIKLSESDINDIDAIYELGEGWVAEEALAIAIYSCLKYSNNFEDAVVCAVNHDGDSDSTGAIAGNIMGARLGINNIPDYYLDNLELRDIIIEIADDLIRPIRECCEEQYWLNKYVDCKK